MRVVAALLIREGRVLLAQRAAHKQQGLSWELPGGKVEAGESDADALVRELREELGVEVSVLGPHAEVTHRYDHGEIHLIALRCALEAGQEPRALEHAALAWALPEEVAAFALASADRALLVGW